MQVVPTRFVSPVLLRGLIAVWLAGAFAVFAFAGVMSLGASHRVAVLLSVGVAASVACVCWKRPVITLDEKAASPALSILFVLAAIASLVQLARLCVFIVNPAAVGYAMSPSRGMGLPIRHSCVSSYFVAGQYIATEPNIYDDKLYSLPTQDPNAPRKPRPIGRFNIDVYEYPPPFLLLPRALAIVAPQFLNFRMLWFALNGSLVLIGLLAVARMFDPVTGPRALLLSPLVLAADMTIGTLQIGNLQAAVFSLAMLAMVFFARRRYAAGGVLLAFVTVSKLFPGMLIVYLAVRREWRAVAWTTGFCAALVGISLLDTGRVPYLAFLDHLPRLLSGESFDAFYNPGAVAKNLSVPGFLFKLKLFGLPNGSFALMKTIGTIYTVIVLAATVVIGMRRPTLNEQPLVWLAVLILASLRSPFLPQYELFAVLWLVTLLAAQVVPSARTLCLALVAWAVLNIAIPINGPDLRLNAAMALVSQVIIIVLLALALRRERQPVVVLQPVASDGMARV
jgi:alpha-1,2-mannosyltransferase